MKYFTIEELCASETARRRGIDNRPSATVCVRLTQLIEQLLDPIRAAWGAPIAVNSGYRSPKLNAAVGGVSTSQHLRGEAADITVGSPADNKRLFDKIVELQKAGRIAFDQLIDESNFRWIHISYRSGANRNQTLHLNN
ncbi:MAG: peptidase M15 [Rikenella sp.]|nr:peptidase M15 [Rikenella sp.]